MRLRWFCLLVCWLAGCDAREPPRPEPAGGEELATGPQQRGSIAADPVRDRLRSQWFLLEHVGWQQISAEPPPVPVLPAPVAASETRPALSFIIDDVGHSYAVGRRLIDMPFPLTLAVLPYTPAGQRIATEAVAAGKTVILHLPMENAAGISPGPGGLYASMRPAEFRQSVAATLDSVPGIRGVNNHMGSRLTTLRPQMDWLMDELAQRKLFFIDSRTQAATQAAQAAHDRGLPHLSRDVFLDNMRERPALEAALQVALNKARNQGHAVVIGHPYPQTIDFLATRVAQLAEQEGVELVALETLLGRQVAGRPSATAR